MPADCVLGINLHHDGAACLVRDGRVVAAIEAERLRRIKHVEIDEPDQVVHYCLAAAGVREEDVVARCGNSAVGELLCRLRAMGIPTVSHHLAHAHGAIAQSGFEDAAVMVLDGSGNRWEDVEAAYRGEGARRDGAEEAESYYLVTGGGRRIEVVKKRWGVWGEERRPSYLRFPSLGHMYSMASEYIFTGWHDAGKVMGLAPYGTGASVSELAFVTRTGESDIDVSTEWIDRLPREHGYGAGWHTEEGRRLYRDLAWRVQRELEEAVVQQARWLRRVTGASRLCVTGGVALNCPMNRRLLREAGFEEVFVPWSPGDSGIAVGCAARALLDLGAGEPRRFATGPYGGRPYADEEIGHVLEAYAGGRLALSLAQVRAGDRVTLRHGPGLPVLEHDGLRLDAAQRRHLADVPFTAGSRVTWRYEAGGGDGRRPVRYRPLAQPFWSLDALPIRFERLDDPVPAAADLLAAGQVVGWFASGSEFGPRALGNRSILADPRDPSMTDRLNRLKGREAFRPVAPVVPLEHAAEYFEVDAPSPYMTAAVPVRPDRRAEIPAVVHHDGTARVQTVTAAQNELLHRLLAEVGRRTGVPVLVNTSLNDRSEPIVETPVEALCAFLRMRLDALVMDHWLVRPACPSEEWR